MIIKELSEEQIDELEKICDELTYYKEDIHRAIKRRQLNTLGNNTAEILRHLLRRRDERLAYAIEHCDDFAICRYSIENVAWKFNVMAKEREVIDSLFELL